ncbi:glycosyl transferase family 2 [Solidesulfovibrio fructosivorans JJ]]|uniref:Glycosyl transferase family 2 n=1 Tax=Solidesulfovibrio fructosivorans JJ] TaxID=596151 RepID=E1JWI4_SOLFR|nr:glycosyltransferase [Solidesulfovibrio fructosivorans]EFL51281.1 glycosyl transferase family 2 [Solidesulfovibrio fructosivorans JJ]]
MISVVLPVRNTADTLPRALASLAAQTLADFELVAVDDGSDDGGATLRVLRAAAGRDARLRVLDRPHDGIAAALNTGLAAARGRYIARMDADDVCHPRRLELQAGYLDAHPEIGLVSCLAAFGGDPDAAAGYLAHIEWANSVRTPQAIRQAIFRESPLPHPTVMFRAELPNRFGGYRDGAFPEDYELWLRWLEAGVDMAKIPQALMTWNDPPGRLSRTDPRYDPEAFHRIKAGYLARLLARINPHHPEIHVVGAGRITRRRAEHLLAHGVVIKAWLDIDPRKVGMVLGGRPVLHMRDAPAPERCFVVPYVASRGAPEYIAETLERRGFKLGRSYLPAA